MANFVTLIFYVYSCFVEETTGASFERLRKNSALKVKINKKKRFKENIMCYLYDNTKPQYNYWKRFENLCVLSFIFFSFFLGQKKIFIWEQFLGRILIQITSLAKLNVLPSAVNCCKNGALIAFDDSKLYCPLYTKEYENLFLPLLEENLK